MVDGRWGKAFAPTYHLLPTTYRFKKAKGVITSITARAIAWGWALPLCSFRSAIEAISRVGCGRTGAPNAHGAQNGGQHNFLPNLEVIIRSYR